MHRSRLLQALCNMGKLSEQQLKAAMARHEKRLTPTEAVAVAQTLLDMGVCRQLSGSLYGPFQDPASIFRFKYDEKTDGILNTIQTWTKAARRANEVSEELLCMAASLLMQRGKTDIAALSAFELSTCELQRVNFRGLNRPAMTAFFINIYNCLVLHSHLVRAKPVELKNKKERQAFSRATKYQIGISAATRFCFGSQHMPMSAQSMFSLLAAGEHVFSLQDIVEQVLLPRFVRHSDRPAKKKLSGGSIE